MSLVLVLIAALLIVLAVTLLTTARLILTPPRMTGGKAFALLQRTAPADLGLTFEPVDFHVRDAARRGSLALAGWWLPHPAGGSKTAILVHGYADAKVGAIAWAPLWQQLGFNVLAYDQRAHGQSGGSYCTGGVYERDDLSQIINDTRAKWPVQSRTIVLFGISLGASPVLGVIAERDDVHAAVLECPFSNYRNAVDGLARQLGTPLRRWLPATLRLAAWMSGADLHRVDNLPLLRERRRPVLAIASSVDPFVSNTDAEAIRAAVDAKVDGSRFWLVRGATHLRAVEANPAAYRQVIVDFLNSISSGN